ncbi:MAG: hypothetical protein ACI8Y3_001668, partial [Paraglaciecola sp.]
SAFDYGFLQKINLLKTHNKFILDNLLMSGCVKAIASIIIFMI